MAQHISRRELKTDEVRETFAHGAEALLSHQTATLMVVIVAVLVAGGVFGWKTYSQRQTVKASAAFDEGMKIFQGRVRVAGEAAQPGDSTFADDETKFTAAARKFGDVAAKYPRTHPGQVAGYYEALSLEKLGKNDEAKKVLQGISNGSGEFSAMARFELAQLSDKMGQGDQAVKLYLELIAKPAVLVPKPVVMLALAQHYAAKNSPEAARIYGQIKSEYPDTPISEQADQELALLPGKS